MREQEDWSLEEEIENEKSEMEAAPTGCYKCGRPGHWSRDCPFSPPNPDNSSVAGAGGGGGGSVSGAGASNFASKPAAKPKRVPRTRPKLTPDLLLSDDGLGCVLRYFPRAFKYRGRGNEVFLRLKFLLLICSKFCNFNGI